MNKGLVLFVKRKHFISSRVLSEDRNRILRSAEIIDVKVNILTYTDSNKVRIRFKYIAFEGF